MVRLDQLRRLFVVTTTVLVLLTSAVGVVLADGPGSGRVDPDSYMAPGSRAEAAYKAKLALASINEDAEASFSRNSQLATPNGPPPDDPPTSVTLDTRSRRQNNDHYCGPAAGQVLINYTRYYWYDNLDGQNASTNYKTQTVIAAKMGTDDEGTRGAGIATGVNAFAQLPYADFYQYQAPAGGSQFHSWIISDIWNYTTPLIPTVIPHDQGDQGATYHLPNWPSVMTTGHALTIRGYNGYWDGTDGPDVYYNDSASPSGPGRYSTGAKTMWKVTSFFVGKVVW